MGSLGANRNIAGSTQSDNANSGSLRTRIASTPEYQSELDRGIARVTGEQRRGNTELFRKLREQYGLEPESTDGNDMQVHPERINGDKVTLYSATRNSAADYEEYEGTFNYYSDGGKEIINIRKVRR